MTTDPRRSLSSYIMALLMVVGVLIVFMPETLVAASQFQAWPQSQQISYILFIGIALSIGLFLRQRDINQTAARVRPSAGTKY